MLARHARSLRRGAAGSRPRGQDGTGNQIPDPLLPWTDPAAADITRVDSEIRLADDLRWMHDFEQAVRVGMAVKVALTGEEVALGVHCLFVLG